MFLELHLSQYLREVNEILYQEFNTPDRDLLYASVPWSDYHYQGFSPQEAVRREVYHFETGEYF